MSYLKSPCVVRTTGSQRPSIAEIEVQHTFTNWMWQRVLNEPQADAICISHLRALHELLTEHFISNTLIIVKHDMEPNTKWYELMCAFLANWHGNPHLKLTKICALTFADWHSGHSDKARH